MRDGCEICKSNVSVVQSIIYKSAGNPMPIFLCPAHDQELFVMGQYRFVKKYRPLLKSDFHIDDSHRDKKVA